MTAMTAKTSTFAPVTDRFAGYLDSESRSFFGRLFGSDFAESRGEDAETALQSAIDALEDGAFLADAGLGDDDQEEVEKLHFALRFVQKWLKV